MNSPTRLVWALAGSPRPQGATADLFTDVPAVCAVCGVRSDRTASADRALGANFTDRSMFRGPQSGRVCVACVAVCSGKPPATFRMWSVVAAPGEDLPASASKSWIRDTPGLCLTSRANPRPIIEMVTSPPAGEWVVSVATSGQKHVLPYATVNRGAGPWTVRMETANVSSTPERFAHVLGVVARLRLMGTSPANVLAGLPPVHLSTVDAVADWKALADQISCFTNSPLLEFALWCLTKEMIDDIAGT